MRLVALDATEVEGSSKWPGDAAVSDGSDSCAFEGMAAGSSGLNGVGKIIMAWTSIMPSKFDLGWVMAVGYDASKKFNVACWVTGSIG